MIGRDQFKVYLSTLLTDEDKKLVAGVIRQKLIAGVVVMIIGIILAIIGIANMKSNIDAVLIFAGVVVFIIGLGIFGTRRSNGYNVIVMKYKEQVIRHVMNGERYTYDPYGSMSRSVYRAAKLPSNYDYYNGEDFLAIGISDNNSKSSEVMLTISDIKTIDRYEDSEGKEHERTLFDGVLGYIEFPFVFNSILTINRPDYVVDAKLEKVNLEGIEFNKKFKIKCSDQIEARYILTTDVMQKLEKMSKHIKSLGLVLHDNMMFITFPKNKLFECNVKSKNVCAGAFERFYDDLEVIIGLIREIQENDKVFKID